MKKVSKVLLFVTIMVLAFIIKAQKSQASVYIWPVGGSNANETYKDYDFYGQAYSAPYKDGKSGREYIVNNKLWPNEKYYYASCESHFGMDISGINGHTYTIVSVSDGTVIATSGTRAMRPSINYIDRNQRRTSAGLNDGGGYGNYIIIQEESTGRCFLYGHLKGNSLKVNKGDTVKAGQEIATMGSSGDSGHMHVHFEIRKSKASTVNETNYGYHYLVTTNSNTNLDPEQYIGTSPNVHTPFEDVKLVKISKDDAKIYVRYLYSKVMGRDANNDELEYWAEKYVSTESIYEVTKEIFLSEESVSKNGQLSNSDFVKKSYEIILYRGNNYTEGEMAGHIDNLDRGIWDRNDYLSMLCNCDEFVNQKLGTIISDIKDQDAKAEEEQKKAEEEEKRQEEEAKRKEEEEKRKKEEEDKKKEQESKYSDIKLYVKYLYKSVLGRNAIGSEVNYWISQYEANQNIGDITKSIFVNSKTEYMDNVEFVKNTYKILLNKTSYTDSEVRAYSDKLDNGEVSREDFISSICNTTEFTESAFKELVKKQEEYENDKKVLPIPSEDKLSKLGDLDGDGNVSAVDASLCLGLYVLDDKTDYQYAIYYADVDKDGIISLMDAVYMLGYSSELSVGNQNNYESIEEYINGK